MLRGRTRWLVGAAILLAGTGLSQAIPFAQTPKSKGSKDAKEAVAIAAAAKVDPRVARLKEAVAADIKSQAMFDLGQVMTDQVFSFGELGFQEFETSKYL